MSDSAAPPDHLLTRRSVVQIALVAALGGTLGTGASRFATRGGPVLPPAWRTLGADEARILTALCEQIIPADDAPGATDAGVVHYIDRQLAGPLKRHRATYTRGLAAVQATSRTLHGTGFAELASADQTALLKAIETGKVPREPWGDPSPQHFMNLLIDHTMQGFYGSPRHGGNKDWASHRMLGLAYPNIIGQNRYPQAGG